MDDGELLARMRRQYQYAALETHMLDADGVLRLRCGICRARPVPPSAGSVIWCDQCLDECLAGDMSLEEFTAAKRPRSVPGTRDAGGTVS
jgi:hypothetical protein